jgi:hypothetical protein
MNRTFATAFGPSVTDKRIIDFAKRAITQYEKELQICVDAEGKEDLLPFQIKRRDVLMQNLKENSSAHIKAAANTPGRSKVLYLFTCCYWLNMYILVAVTNNSYN